MKNQTTKNDPNNRGQNEQTELEMKLRLIWLGIECLVKTFDRGSDEEIDVDEIKELLSKDDAGITFQG